MPTKRIAPKPECGYLGSRIALARDPRAERCRIQCEASPIALFNFRGIEITVEKRQMVEPKSITAPPGVEAFVTATRYGEPLAIDGHLRFFPPPIMVADGTYHIELIDGESVEIANHREDPRQALMEVIGQTVMGQIK